MGHLTAPVYTTKNPVTCAAGRATTASAKLLVATLIDPASPVQVTVNGVVYTGVTGIPSGNQFQLVARGSPTICWTGVLTITSGLSAYTRYAWSVSQGDNSDAGSFFVEPNDTTSPFQLHTAGCDNNTFLGNLGNIRPWLVPGNWQYIRAATEAANPPVVGCTFCDDLGYVAGLNIKDDGSAYALPGYSGLACTGDPGTTGSLNDFLIAWCALFGMLGPTQTTYTDANLTSSDALLYVLWAREANRAWCRKNLNFFTQWGDWEFANDMSWDTQPNNNQWTNGKAAWNAFYGLIKPPLNGVVTPRDAGSNHWAFKIGNVVLVAPDGYTSAARTWGTAAVPTGPSINEPVASASLTQFTAIYGFNQIDDCLEAINTLAGDFTVMLLGHSLRYPVVRTGNTPPEAFTATVYEWQSGAQHPLYDHCLRDFQRLFTDQGNNPPSIMDNPKTNGKRGNFFTLHYDYHHAMVTRMVHGGYTDVTFGVQVAENFYHLNPGTSNASSYFSDLSGNINYTYTANMVVEYTDPHGAGNPAFHGCSLTKADAWLTARITGTDNETLWQGRFCRSGSNLAYSVDKPSAFRATDVQD